MSMDFFKCFFCHLENDTFVIVVSNKLFDPSVATYEISRPLIHTNTMRSTKNKLQCDAMSLDSEYINECELIFKMESEENQ